MSDGVVTQSKARSPMFGAEARSFGPAALVGRNSGGLGGEWYPSVVGLNGKQKEHHH